MADTLNIYRDQGSGEPPSGGTGRVVLIIAVLVLIAGVLGYFFLQPKETPPPPAPVDAGPPPPPKPMLPSPSESDPRVRSLLSGASTEPAWASWLTRADLVRLFTSATANIAEGESPRSRLSFMAPAGKFETQEKADKKNKKVKKTFIAPAQYARYDVVAKTIGSLDETTIANAYVALKPWIDLAYAEIGPRNAKFDPVFQGAINRLVNAPVPAGDVELVPKGGVFAFADEKLESLSAAEKHLVRMGPANQKTIQTKLKALAEAIANAESSAQDGGMADVGDGGTMETTGDGGSMGSMTGDAGATGGSMTGSMTGDAGEATAPTGTTGGAAAVTGADSGV